MYEWVPVVGGIFMFVIYLAFVGLCVWAAYLVIRAAVRSAMDDHFRKVKWYQETGLWYGGRPPKGLPGTTELSRGETKRLPKEERPE